MALFSKFKEGEKLSSDVPLKGRVSIFNTGGGKEGERGGKERKQERKGGEGRGRGGKERGGEAEGNLIPPHDLSFAACFFFLLLPGPIPPPFLLLRGRRRHRHTNEEHRRQTRASPDSTQKFSVLRSHHGETEENRPPASFRESGPSCRTAYLLG